MKEKIWKEKLIRYLLESKWEEYKEEYYEWYRDVELEQNIDSLSDLKPFIKWLVENDKIDRKKFWNSETKSSKYSDFELSYDTPREDYTNILLMELAIQDEPIQFLIEILR